MMTATPIFFVLYKPYMPIISYQKLFLKFSLLKKNLTFCSVNWLHLFSSLWHSVLFAYINVHPNVMLLANICNGIDGIKCSHDCGSRGTIDKKGFSAFTFMLHNHFFQFFWIHSSPKKEYFPRLCNWIDMCILGLV